MERRKALAVATAATFILGGAVVATASVSGASFLGFGGTKHGPGSFAASVVTNKQGVVVRKKDVYDRYVVDTTAPGASDAAGSSGSSAGVAAAANGWPAAAPTTAAPAYLSEPPATTPATEPSSGNHDDTPVANSPAPAKHADDHDTESSPPPTAATTVPTTQPPATTTTVFYGEYHVPSDWPSGTPLPPFPSGTCHEPTLRWNHVDTTTAHWVCDD
jgi:hypothetical protein